MQFRPFMEAFKDIFGFDDEFRKMSQDKPKVVDEKPIQQFNSVGMMEHLARQKVGVFPYGIQEFNNVVQWGKGPGSIRVRVGSQYTIYIERLIHDLDQCPIWVTKEVFRVNVDDYTYYAESVGDSIHEEVQKVSSQNLDAANKDFPHVHELTEMIADEMKNYANQMFVFDSIKKVNENNSIIIYWVKGGGVGALYTAKQGNYINEVIVDVSHNPLTGMIRIMNTSVQSGHEGISWHIMPSFFEGMFCPTQDFKEIADAVVTAMKWF